MIIPKQRDLVAIVDTLLNSTNSHRYGQLRISNYVINFGIGIAEILVLGVDGVVVDGYSAQPREFKYKNLFFMSCLVGQSNKAGMYVSWLHQLSFPCINIIRMYVT